MSDLQKRIFYEQVDDLKYRWENVQDLLYELDPEDDSDCSWDTLMKEWLDFKEAFESIWACHCIGMQSDKFKLEVRQEKLFSKEYLDSLNN